MSRKVQIIPGVNPSDFDTLQERIRRAEALQPVRRAQGEPDGGWVHIDVADGIFTPHRTWNTPEDLPRLQTSLSLEIHLMVENPEGVIDAWLRNGARRIVVHLEAMTDPVYILEKCKKYNAECMLAISPQTDVERLRAHTDFTAFQVLAVTPGPSGQPFQENMLEKVSFLRAHMPNATIEVDGGVNDETAPRIIAAGADILVSTSYIFENPDPEEAYQKLITAGL